MLRWLKGTMPLSNHNLKFSASAISVSPRGFFETLEIVEAGGVDRIHIDVMDGQFVPRLGLYPEFVSEVRNATSLPIDIHMMVQRPEQFIGDFASAGATRIVPHVESTNQVYRLVDLIRSEGAEAGMALNPHSGPEELRFIAQDLSVVTAMTINPGIVGHALVPFALHKIRAIRQFFDEFGHQCVVEADGGVVFSNVRALALAGADQVVIGAGTLYNRAREIGSNLAELLAIRDELDEVGMR